MHRSVEQISLSPQDAWLAVTTISFDIAGLELYSPLITGAKIVLASKDESSDAPVTGSAESFSRYRDAGDAIDVAVLGGYGLGMCTRV